MGDDAANRLAAMVEAYFRGVDERDMSLILSVLSGDCQFTVESHGDTVTGHDGLRAMFGHIWESPGSVRHHDFVHTVDLAAGRIASQFQVTYALADGRIVRKSNCNVFTLDGDRFARVQVYMAGDNRLKPPPAR